MSPFSFSILFSLQSSIPNPFPNDVMSTGILDGDVVLKHPRQERKLILRNLHSKASFLPTKSPGRSTLEGEHVIRLPTWGLK